MFFKLILKDTRLLLYQLSPLKNPASGILNICIVLLLHIVQLYNNRITVDIRICLILQYRNSRDWNAYIQNGQFYSLGVKLPNLNVGVSVGTH